jgi:ubiquinone/menaquinone biosynthesis C-methylase UbiE
LKNFSHGFFAEGFLSGGVGGVFSPPPTGSILISLATHPAEINVENWVHEIEFERHGAIRKTLKSVVINPLANYLPSGLVKAVLKATRSELALSNWSDPGGWQSMVISYDARPRQIADKVLVGGGTMAMALRNRRQLGGTWIARLIDSSKSDPVHVLCLGAGPGHIICDAMKKASRRSVATLVDISSSAFEYGRNLANKSGLNERMRFIESDVRDVKRMLDRPVDIVKMLGICEYLTDEQIVSIAQALGVVMPAGAPIILNSLSHKHGTDRFFRRVFGLHMHHRSPEQISKLFQQAGFGDFATIAEPLGVYHVIAAHRRADSAGSAKG